MYCKFKWTDGVSSGLVVVLVCCYNVAWCQGGLSTSLTDDDLYQLINLATTGQKFQGKPEIYYAEPDHNPNSLSRQHLHAVDAPSAGPPVTLPNEHYGALPPRIQYYSNQRQPLYPVPHVDMGAQGLNHLIPDIPEQQQQQQQLKTGHEGSDRYLEGKKRSSAIEIVSSLELPSEHTQYHEDPSGGLTKIVPQPEEHQQPKLADLSPASQSKLAAPITGAGGDYLPVGNSISDGDGALPPTQLIPLSHNHLIRPAQQPQPLTFPIFKNIPTQQGAIYQFGLPPPAPAQGPAPAPAYAFLLAPSTLSHPPAQTSAAPLLSGGAHVNPPASLTVNMSPGPMLYESPVPSPSPAQPQFSQVADPNPTPPPTSAAPAQQPHDHSQVHQLHQQSHRTEHQQAVEQQLLKIAKGTPSAVITRHEPAPTPIQQQPNSPISIQRPQLYSQQPPPQFVHQPQPIQFGQPILQSPQLPTHIVPQIQQQNPQLHHQQQQQQQQQQQPLYTYTVQSPDANRLPLYHTLLKYPIQPQQQQQQSVYPQQQLIAQSQPQQVQYSFIPFNAVQTPAQHPTQTFLHPNPALPSVQPNPERNGEPSADDNDRVPESMEPDETEYAHNDDDNVFGMPSEGPLTASEESIIARVQKDPEGMEFRHHNDEPIVTMNSKRVVSSSGPVYMMMTSGSSPTGVAITPGEGHTKSVITTTRIVTHRYKKPLTTNKSRSIMRATMNSNNNVMKVTESSN